MTFGIAILSDIDFGSQGRVRNLLPAANNDEPARKGEAVTEAPNDGKLYGRRNNGWSQITISLTLAGLTDVLIDTPADGQLLTYEASTSRWKNKAAPGGTVQSVNGVQPVSGNVVLPVVYKVNGVAPNAQGFVTIPVGTVKTVNGISPDANGAITIPSSGLLTVNHIAPDTAGNVNIVIPASAPRVQEAGAVNGAINCNWALYDEIRITATGATSLIFTGAVDGQRCILVLRQDTVGGRSFALPNRVRYNAVYPSYTATATPQNRDKLIFQYDDGDVRYDLVTLITGIDGRLPFYVGFSGLLNINYQSIAYTPPTNPIQIELVP